MATRYDHVIWDWNGTLFDDAWLCVEIMDAMLRARGMGGLTLERYQELFDFPVIDYYRRLGFDLRQEAFEVCGTEFIRTYEGRRNEATLQPEAQAVLRRVEEAGIQQSLLSAYKQDTLEELTRHFGIRDRFNHVLGLDNHYAQGKTENGRRWMRESKLPPSRVLLVGDTTHDHEVAVAMGADCVLIPSGHHSHEKLQVCGVPIVKSLREALEFIRRGYRRYGAEFF